jgi:hypothetical protein
MGEFIRFFSCLSSPPLLLPHPKNITYFNKFNKTSLKCGTTLNLSISDGFIHL